ncbi:MAG: DNA repair protein RadC [Bacilli bacterium]|nr:DNA repair protein RadC [Bacilli bacterium]
MEVINIKKLPELERPREKAKHYGINKLSNIELLALVIGSGTRDANVLMVAQDLLTKTHGIEHLLNISYQDLLKVNGIKEATALRFLAINELVKRAGQSSVTSTYQSSEGVARRYQQIIGGNNNESLYLIGLDDKGKLVKEREIYVGTNSHFVSSEEEIINYLKKEQIRFFMLVHNHPSGNVEPSKDDIIATNHLLVRAKRNNLILVDHIIVHISGGYYSFRETQGLLH